VLEDSQVFLLYLSAFDLIPTHSTQQKIQVEDLCALYLLYDIFFIELTEKNLLLSFAIISFIAFSNPPPAYNWSKMMRYVVTMEKKVRIVEP
jgi:hypothetical protein